MILRLIAGEYDFRLLDLSQIESIEIIKGASSTLYGTGAASAVINITTKAASAKKMRTVFSTSLGTNQTATDQNDNIADINTNVAFSGTLKKFTYRAAFSNQSTDGLSAVISEANEKDAFSKYGVDTSFGYNFSNAFSLHIYGNYSDTKSEIDGYDSNFSLADTADRI